MYSQKILTQSVWETKILNKYRIIRISTMTDLNLENSDIILLLKIEKCNQEKPERGIDIAYVTKQVFLEKFLKYRKFRI